MSARRPTSQGQPETLRPSEPQATVGDRPNQDKATEQEPVPCSSMPSASRQAPSAHRPPRTHPGLTRQAERPFEIPICAPTLDAHDAPALGDRDADFRLRGPCPSRGIRPAEVRQRRAERPQPGTARCQGHRREPASNGGRRAVDAGLRRPRHGPARPFAAGAGAGADGQPRGGQGAARLTGPWQQRGSRPSVQAADFTARHPGSFASSRGSAARCSQVRAGNPWSA